MTPHVYRRGRRSRRGTATRGWAATEFALFLPVFLSLIWILAYAGRWIVWNIGAVNAASSCAQLAGRAGTAQSGLGGGTTGSAPSAGEYVANSYGVVNTYGVASDLTIGTMGGVGCSTNVQSEANGQIWLRYPAVEVYAPAQRYQSRLVDLQP